MSAWSGSISIVAGGDSAKREARGEQAMATSRAGTAIARRGGYRTLGVVSLAVGPLIMAIGDLVHPKEASDLGRQAAIIVEQASRWYLAHLLLFLGLVVFVPGLLTLADLATARRPRVGYAARVLVVVGVGGSAALFVAEMLAGRLGSLGAAATEEFLETMFSGPIAGPMLLVALALFVGAAVFAVPLIAGGGPLRWPAVVLLVGVLLVLAEIVSAQVLLSQIGNLLIWGGSAAFAWLLVRGEAGAPAAAGAGEALPAG
jgi:hypothetical protein